MAKYYKFHYSDGYVGTHIDEVFKYDDDVPDQRIESDFEDWYEFQRSDNGGFVGISEEEAEELGIDEDLSTEDQMKEMGRLIE